MAVLVTGGSEGIGLELARCFARDGHDLVLVARHQQRLDEAAAELSINGPAVHVIAADLGVEGEPARVLDEIRRRGLAVDVLVNNAGYGLHGDFVETPLGVETSMIRLNVEALVVLSKGLLPEMRARGSGGILNVGSVAGFQPGPLMAIYYATKAFVLSFSEALSEELRGSGVKVCVLCPGPTDTGFQRRAGVGRTLFSSGGMSPAKVARIGYVGFNAGRRVVIPGMGNFLLTVLVRLAPRRWVTHIVRGLQEKRRR